MTPDQLDRYRRAVAEDASGPKLEQIVAKLKAAGVEPMGHGVLKTAPKGYPKDHPRIELLRYKGIVAWQEWPAGAWLGTRRAKDRIEKVFTASKPLNDWLRTNVGSG
jgi:uncharacterized protein (DUF2461 family)